MARRAEVLLDKTTGVVSFSGAGTQTTFKTPAGVLYQVFVDTGSDVAWRKSTNGGTTWTAPVLVSGAISCTQLAVAYDRDCGYAAGLIHVAFTESGGSDILYRSIDTEGADALGTQTTIFAGISVLGGGHLSITVARGGNLLCEGVIDNGVEGGFFRSIDRGANWTSRTISEALAQSDQVILLPDFAADNQDICAVYWDASADELSIKRYDDSADTWSEASIATSMVDSSSVSEGFPHFAAAIDLANSRHIVAAWSAVDTVNADLRCWTITSTTVAEVANVVQNSGDDQGLVAVGIDTENDHWYVFYAGKSDGSEAWKSAVNIYYQVSRDHGTSWGAAVQLTPTASDTRWLTCTSRFTRPFGVAYHVQVTIPEFRFSAPIVSNEAHSQLGG